MYLSNQTVLHLMMPLSVLSTREIHYKQTDIHQLMRYTLNLYFHFISSPKNENYIISRYQTCMTCFLQWNTKKLFLAECPSISFHTMKVNGDHGCQAGFSRLLHEGA